MTDQNGQHVYSNKIRNLRQRLFIYILIQKYITANLSTYLDLDNSIHIMNVLMETKSIFVNVISSLNTAYIHINSLNYHTSCGFFSFEI